MEHALVQPASGSIVHLEVGDTLEVRIVEDGGAAWRTDLRPQGLVEVWDSGQNEDRTARVRTLVLRADFGLGGLLRLVDDEGSALDVCITISERAGLLR
jgi:hypothetical protein